MRKRPWKPMLRTHVQENPRTLAGCSEGSLWLIFRERKIARMILNADHLFRAGKDPVTHGKVGISPGRLISPLGSESTRNVPYCEDEIDASLRRTMSRTAAAIA